MPDIRVSDSEVEAELGQLDCSKAAGHDDIHPLFLKMLARIIASPLSELFNESLATGELPQDWKLAVVSPVYKHGGQENPANYRPVSLTSVPCKVME